MAINSLFSCPQENTLNSQFPTLIKMTKATFSKSKGAKSAGTNSSFQGGGINQQSLPGPSVATRSHGPVDDDDASVGSSKSMSTNGGGTYGFNIDYLGTGIPELIDKCDAYLRSNGCQGLMNSDVLGNLYRRGFLCTSVGGDTILSRLGPNVPDWAVIMEDQRALDVSERENKSFRLTLRKKANNHSGPYGAAHERMPFLPAVLGKVPAHSGRRR